MVTSGKLKADQAGELSEMLAYDLRNYPMDWVEDAIQQHRENSPFWPSLSDLMKFLKPKIERQHRAAERVRLAEKIAREKAGEAFEEPDEVRAAAVAEWNEWGRQELAKLGIDAEERLIHPHVRKRRAKQREKVEPTQGEMIDSVKRIADFERASGDPARAKLADKMMEGIAP